MRRRSIATLAGLFFASLALAVPAAAWKGELADGVTPITEVLEKAEKGDWVIVEGEITRVTTGSGNRLIVFFADATGQIPLAVPNHLLRHFAGGGPKGGSGPGGVTPEVGQRARVGGKWDHAHLDDDTWGIRVQRVEPLED
jgi:hypothetical protein